MRQYLMQCTVLMVVCGISICLAGEKEKKCPPEGAELHPLKWHSMEETDLLIDNWILVKCSHWMSNDKLSCAEVTNAQSKKGFFSHASAYNESSSSVWATSGRWTFEEPGVAKGTFKDHRIDGKYTFLLVKKKMYIVAACLKNNEFVLWVFSKHAELEPSDEVVIEQTLKKNGLESLKLNRLPFNDCAKLKSSI